MLLLLGDAPMIPISHQVGILAIGDDEISAVRGMIVRTDIHVAFAAVLKERCKCALIVSHFCAWARPTPF